jgi:hypothetical protein
MQIALNQSKNITKEKLKGDKAYVRAESSGSPKRGHPDLLELHRVAGRFVITQKSGSKDNDASAAAPEWG